MDIKPYQNLNLDDFFSERTFNYRKLLIFLSFLLCIMILLDIIPTKIETLGIEIAPLDRLHFIGILYISNAYLCLSFVLFGFSDFWKFKADIQANAFQYEFAMQNFDDINSELIQELQNGKEKHSGLPDVNKLQEEKEELNELISELKELEKVSHFVSESESKLNKINKKRGSIYEIIRSYSERNEIEEELKKKLNRVLRHLDIIDKFEKNWYIEKSSQLSLIKLIYFYLVPGLMFLISSVIALHHY